MLGSKKCIAFIFARGGSKGVLRKNLKPLDGKPLIAYSINSALENELIDEVIVSTDDSEIAEVAKSLGAKVPFIRPEELARDDSPEWLSWQHAVKYCQNNSIDFDIFVVLPATAPLRNNTDITKCIEKLESSNSDMIITVRNAERNPWFNMVKKDEKGQTVIVNKPKENIFRRQDVPIVFDMTTVAYVSSKEYILEKTSIFDGTLDHVVIPKERAIDIDDEVDFEFAEYLLRKNV